jgi:uncharacterized membrane protein
LIYFVDIFHCGGIEISVGFDGIYVVDSERAVLMNRLSQHFTKCLLAGIVAILPIGGLVLIAGYIESSISKSGLLPLPFYFPGLGILSAIVLIYLVGLMTTTVIGGWVWSHADHLIQSLPALGKMYASLKQILGYGQGEDAMFYETVLVQCQNKHCEEMGLVTREIALPDGTTKLVIFVPGSPNPTFGRLVIASREQIKSIKMPAHEALKALVAVGKTEIHLD